MLLSHYSRYLWQGPELVVIAGDAARLWQGCEDYGRQHAIAPGGPDGRAALRRLLAAAALAAVSLPERESWGWTLALPGTTLGLFCAMEPEGMACACLRQSAPGADTAVVQRQKEKSPLTQSTFTLTDADPLRAVEGYFASAAQMLVRLAVLDDGRGAFVQPLPGHGFGPLDGLGDSELVEQCFSLHERDRVKLLDEVVLFYGCRCSDEMIINMFREFASKYNIYIIGGSTPTLREGKLYNTAHLFTPSGQVHTQDKLHITPLERSESDIQPGSAIRIFQTPLARIAIQICYDIEFPEVSRLLTLAGAEVIFVPFCTEEKKAYYRIRHCAQARAVENFVYVVMTGSVGNMRTSIGSFLNYSQAAILSPSDFSFPEKGIEGEADPNIEAVVVSELALSALMEQRHVATVRPLHDRRSDLYDLQMKGNIEVIKID